MNIKNIPMHYARQVLIDWDECWIWCGCIAQNMTGTGGNGKYGLLTYKGKQIRAHRAFYTWVIGDIPSGRHVHHICKNTLCVNPDHLKVVTLEEHNHLHTSFVVLNAVKTHCPKGHEYRPETIRTHLRGWRVCILCEYERGVGRKRSGLRIKDRLRRETVT